MLIIIMQRKLARHTRKPLPLTVILLLSMTLLVLLSACDISEPQLPSFGSHLNIPLGVERFTVGEAIDDDPNLELAPDGGISFVASSSPDTLSLGLDLNLEVPGQQINQLIGTFTVTPPAPVSVSQSLLEAFPAAAEIVGTPAPLAPFDFSLEEPGLQLENLETCTIASGILKVDINNTWPVAISGTGTGDPLTLALYDSITDELLLTAPVGPIPASGETSTTISLAGIRLVGQVKIIIEGHGDGSGNDTVTLTGEEELVLQLAFDNLLVSSATAALAAQTFSFIFLTDWGENEEITAAEFSSGTLVMQLHNQLPIPVTLDLSWDRVIDPEGNALALTVELPALGNSFLDIPFANCRIEDQGVPLTSLAAHVIARTSGSGGQLVTLTSTQGFLVDLEPGVLIFSLVNGCFTPSTWDLEPSTEHIEYPQDSEGVNFTEAVLTINLANSADLGADLDLTITGTPAHGSPVSLAIHDRVDPVSGGNAKTVLILDPNNSDIIQFINSRPEIITLAGTMSLTPGASCGTVRALDQLIVSWNLEVPLIVTLTGATISGTPTPLGLDTKVQDMITDHAEAAEFRADVVNHIPVDIDFLVLLAVDPANLPTQPDLIIGPIHIDKAQVDPLSGEAQTSTVSHPVVQLDPTETTFLGQPNLHSMYQIVLPSGGPTPVRVLSTDYLEILGTVGLDLRIDGEF